MITVQAEFTPRGTLQHCVMPSAWLAACLYEEALHCGLDATMGQASDGKYFVDFYADDDLYTAVYRAAQDTADEEMMRRAEAAQEQLAA